MGTDPAGIAVHPLIHTAFVPNAAVGTLSVIDGTAVTQTVAVGADSQGVAVDIATNSIYVANHGSDSVAVLT